MTMNIERLEPGARLSQAVIAGDFVFLAGQVARDPSQPVADQTRQVLAEVNRLLAAAGSSRSRLVSVTIYLADMGDFAAMNSVWDSWVPPDAKPARATVEAKLATPAYRVEVQAVAVRG
jgi:enamine deaminase RidA (YjgF/YER057c/UK114 family)